MNYINKINILFVITIIFCTSCNTKKQQEAIFKDNPNVYRIELENGETKIVKKNYKDDFIFENWNAYNVATAKLMRMEDSEYKISKNQIIRLKKFINNLSATTPKWLKSAEVSQEIKDVEEEYKELIDEINRPTQTIRKNCKALNEEFDELKDSLNEVVKDYTSS